jgi:hypothetical protein
MIYSVHDPYTGQFRYFEGGENVAINDDLPTPRWGKSVRTKLGIPASAAGRPLPVAAVPVGQGALPVGLMSTGQQGEWRGTQKGALPSGLGAVDFSVQGMMPVALLLGAGASALYGWTKRDEGWPFLGLGALMLVGAMAVGGRT